jgi:hypothetical protein
MQSELVNHSSFKLIEGCKDAAVYSKSKGRRVSRFSLGYRYCKMCCLWFKTQETYCRGCGNKLRVNPRNNRKCKDNEHHWFSKKRDKTRI